jgi:NodT family efflux transporter outer membrane factor (OMF) lipoprotein
MRNYLWPAAALSLAGCITVGPSYEEPRIEDVQEGYVYGDEPVYRTSEQNSVAAWWTRFSDERIAEAVRLATEQNRDLVAAAFRLEAAEARAGAARRALLPQGGASFGITRQKQARAQFAGIAGGGDDDAPPSDGGGGEDGDGDAPPAFPFGNNDPFTLYQAQAQAAWEVDLFGRIRRQAQGASARAEQQRELLADAQRLTAARVVDTYLLLVEALNRRRVALDNLALQERSLELTEALVELGEVPQLNLLQQRSLVRTTAAQVKQVETAAADATSSLALLVGLSVPDFLARFDGLVDEVVAPPIPSAEGAIVLAEPREVLRRRPDIRAAERALAAETYDIGVETAGLFPQINVTGSASLTALDFSGLGQEDAFGFAYGPSISWNILSYPQLLAQRAAAKAEAGAALAAYEQAVLTALTETDRALALHAGAREQALLLSEAERDAVRSAELIEARYREGADSLLALLDAQRTALNVQDQAVTAKIAALRTRASVHRVLAD